MHQPSRSGSPQGYLTAQRDNSKERKAKKGKKARCNKGPNAFASADDYMPEIENDLAALPADVSVGEEEGASGSAQGRCRSRTKSRQRGKA